MEPRETYNVAGIDLSALAHDMLRWEQMKRQLDELEAAIRDTVLQLGKTQTVGNVTASYSGGRKSYDYEGAIASYSRTYPLGDLRDKYAKLIYDYKGMCGELGIVANWTKSPPSVTVKLLT